MRRTDGPVQPGSVSALASLVLLIQHDAGSSPRRATLFSCLAKRRGQEKATLPHGPAGSLGCSNLPGRAQLTSLRSVQTRGAKSDIEVAARRPANSALRVHAEGVNSQEYASLRVASMGAAQRACTLQVDDFRAKASLCFLDPKSSDP